MSMQYQARNGLTDKEARYTLTPTGIDWQAGEKSGSLAFDAITSLRLIDYVSPNGTAYQCTIKSHGHKPLKFRSQHYVSLGAFEDRRTGYSAFVRALLHRLEHRNDIRFIAGSTGLWIMWLSVGLIYLGVALVLVLVILEEVASINLSGIPAIIIAIVAVPLVWRSVRKGRAKRFDPRDPPASLLGAA
ncbi:hypothetical protein GCM10007989_27600 [Devosia pacifica]|uniref:Uncharacterized protein n=1 Tax=Devosia pacifica TaxID=1335967 RepID=A0A918SBE9_9HYPH|nr:hypothetical protein [Devosia pacifica]GHA30340.1 hypothetical protein GCM10007989_27600 [Devosia pacifica]